MGILKSLGSGLVKLGNALAAAPTSEYSAGGGGWTPDFGLGRRGSNQASWLVAAEDSARLAAVISRISEDVACNPWNVFQKSPDGTKKLVESGPLCDWMACPWTAFDGGTWFSLMYLTTAWLNTVGEAFWLLVRKNGRVTETIPFPPSWISMVPSETGSGGSYVVCVPDNRDQVAARIAPEDMVWLRKPSISNPIGRGRGKAQAIDDEVSQDESAAKFLNSYFKNSAKPDLVVFVDGLQDQPNQIQVLRRQWEEHHRGIGNAHRPAFLPANGRLEQVSVSLKEMAFVELRTFSRDCIWQQFQVPPEIMGAVENSNRATAEAALHIYQTNVLRPNLILQQQELARWFVPTFKTPGLILVPKNPVQESEDFRLRKSLEMWKSGLISRDTARQDQAYDPIGGANGPNLSVPLNAAELKPDGTFNIFKVPKNGGSK